MRRLTIVAGSCALLLAGAGGAAWAAFSGKVDNAGNTLSAKSSFARCYGDEVLADAPQHYWRLDETSGTNAADDGSSPANATYTGGATVGQSGALAEAPNKATAFDGTDDWVNIPDQSYAGDFTVEFWVYVTNPGTRGPTSQGNADATIGQEGAGADINFFGSKARLYNGSADVVASDEPVQAATWEHYVVTRSGTTVRLYRNGVEASSTGTWSGTFTPKAIGRGNAGYLLGRMDDVAMWGSALTATRIRAHYNAGRCVRDEPLADNPVAFWRLGEPVTSALAFDSSNLNHGTASAGVSFNQASGLDGDTTGKAADFDGLSGWITPPDLGSTVDFTLTGWTYLTDATWNSTQNFNEVMYGQSGKLRLIIRPSGWYAGPYPGNVEYQVQGSNGTNANINAWVHWAVVRNGATLKVYRNGVEVGSRSDLPATTTQTLGGQLGRDNSSYLLKGKIDDVAVYTSALSAQRVRAQYIAGRAYRDVLLEDGPVSYWRLGESSGTAAADEKSANAGTYTNSPTLAKGGAVAGDASTSVQFDGVDDYVSVASSASLNPTSALSVETWVYPKAGGTQRYVSKFGQYTLRQVFATQQAELEVNVGGSYFNARDPATLSLNQWHHLVGTYDGTNIKVYVDGNLKATTAQAGALSTSANNLEIGRYQGNSEYFNGRLDETAVYSKALSADQVKLHYEAGRDAPR